MTHTQRSESLSLGDLFLEVRLLLFRCRRGDFLRDFPQSLFQKLHSGHIANGTRLIGSKRIEGD